MQPALAPDAPANLPAEPVIDEQQQAEGSPADARPQLTPIEDLTPESDYTQFLADDVPEALKRAALRKLWTSDPVLACLDGLNDYEEDFNVIDTAISAADTSYKVGRGFLDMDEPEVAETPSSRSQQRNRRSHRVMSSLVAKRKTHRTNQRSMPLKLQRRTTPRSDSAEDERSHQLAADPAQTSDGLYASINSDKIQRVNFADNYAKRNICCDSFALKLLRCKRVEYRFTPHSRI